MHNNASRSFWVLILYSKMIMQILPGPRSKVICWSNLTETTKHWWSISLRNPKRRVILHFRERSHSWKAWSLWYWYTWIVQEISKLHQLCILQIPLTLDLKKQNPWMKAYCCKSSKRSDLWWPKHISETKVNGIALLKMTKTPDCSFLMSTGHVAHAGSFYMPLTLENRYRWFQTILIDRYIFPRHFWYISIMKLNCRGWDYKWCFITYFKVQNSNHEILVTSWVAVGLLLTAEDALVGFHHML